VTAQTPAQPQPALCSSIGKAAASTDISLPLAREAGDVEKIFLVSTTTTTTDESPA